MERKKKKKRNVTNAICQKRKLKRIDIGVLHLYVSAKTSDNKNFCCEIFHGSETFPKFIFLRRHFYLPCSFLIKFCPLSSRVQSKVSLWFDFVLSSSNSDAISPVIIGYHKLLFLFFVNCQNFLVILLANLEYLICLFCRRFGFLN